MAKKKAGGKKGGGKKGGKKVDFETSDAALCPFGVGPRDIIRTPLGVYATVLGVSKGELWIQWPGEIKSPLPSKAKCKQDMETYGYFRMPNWAHIQRSIDERSCALFNQKYKGGPPPRQSAMWLPNYTSASAGAAAGPGVSERPMTAPA